MGQQNGLNQGDLGSIFNLMMMLRAQLHASHNRVYILLATVFLHSEKHKSFSSRLLAAENYHP